jgi:aspartate-semialdehyde dehydrogenase
MGVPAQRIKVGILGATGIVGQRLIQMLENHPRFEVAFLAASQNSVGKTYQEVCKWKLAGPMPAYAKEIVVEDIVARTSHPRARLVFSSLNASIATEAEKAYAFAGCAVVSNSSSYRMTPDVPLVIPEINANHISLIETQRTFPRGFIVTNPNCSATALALALAPLEQQFGVESVFVVTAQAVSGAGYPGVASLDVLGNVLPYIPEEEEKIERETKKIFGALANGEIILHSMNISAQCTRVPVIDAHTEMVSVKLKRSASVEEVREAFLRHRSTLIVRKEIDRPQPRLDAEAGNGMATVIGRIRKCPLFDVKFALVGHNTIRGAAGAAILNAELLKEKGYLG